jgi:hypothetical protein
MKFCHGVLMNDETAKWYEDQMKSLSDVRDDEHLKWAKEHIENSFTKEYLKNISDQEIRMCGRVPWNSAWDACLQALSGMGGELEEATIHRESDRIYVGSSAITWREGARWQHSQLMPILAAKDNRIGILEFKASEFERTLLETMRVRDEKIQRLQKEVEVLETQLIVCKQQRDGKIFDFCAAKGFSEDVAEAYVKGENEFLESVTKADSIREGKV